MIPVRLILSEVLVTTHTTRSFLMDKTNGVNIHSTKTKVITKTVMGKWLLPVLPKLKKLPEGNIVKKPYPYWKESRSSLMRPPDIPTGASIMGKQIKQGDWYFEHKLIKNDSLLLAVGCHKNTFPCRKKWDLLEGPKGRFGWGHHPYTLLTAIFTIWDK